MDTRKEALQKLREELQQKQKDYKNYVVETLKDEEPISKFRVESLSEYCDVIKIITETWRRKIAERQTQEKNHTQDENYTPFHCGELSPWFRGVSKERYNPEPTLFRFYREAIHKPGKGNQYKGVTKDIGIMETEAYFLKRFKTFATPFLEKEPANDIEWQFLMRHHEVPSRLVDWSKGSFVALYFATKKSLKAVENPLNDLNGLNNDDFNDPQKPEEEEGAVVWMLEPRRLSEMFEGRRSIYGSNDEKTKEYFCPQNNKEECPDRDSSKWYPLPIIPDIISPRIQAHIGRFTFHPYEDCGKDCCDFESGGLMRFAKKALKDDGLSYLVKIVIPRKYHIPIIRSLRSTGITDMNFTQDLDGISEDISLRIHLGRRDHNRFVDSLNQNRR